MVATEDALSGQIRTRRRPPRQGQDALQQPADRPDLGRGGRAGRCAGRDDRRDPPDARPVRHADRRPEAALRVAGDRLPARHARLPDPRRPDPLERRGHDPLRADARLHRHRPRLGRAPRPLPAGPHGGNMDIVETCPGNTVYLPVFVPGRPALPGRRPRRDGPRRAVGHRPGDARRDDDHRRPAQGQAAGLARGSSRPTRS